MADLQSGASQVQGEKAENAAVAGNPVLVGGRYDASARSLDDGDVGAIALAADGSLISLEVEATFDHGAKSSISTSAVQITASSIPAVRGVLVKAANGNTGIIYVGNSDVTNGSVDATDGFELGAGESVLVKVNNANLVYVIGSAAGQKVFWVTV
jgi:hypothetical protein